MRRDSLKLSQRHRRWFYFVFALLFLSGAVWLALHQWGGVETDLGPQPNAAEPWLLRVHGAAAMAALVILGTMIPLHLRRGWRAGRNRGTGVLITSVCVVLIVSGYLLYYAGGESLRRVTVLLHDGVGLALPLLLAWHILRGRRTSRPPRPPFQSGHPVTRLSR